MCGIYLTNIPFDENDVHKKLKSIEYRGPDNLGYSKIKNISLGHLRLSILDLDERSNQPFKHDNYHITFNGEIYNYLDVKKELQALGCIFTTSSDTEVLLIGYAQWGKKILDKINGMFSFCIYDTLKQEIFCARDRLGVKPFYYFWDEGSFEICSQIKPLSNDKNISHEAFGIYLDCGYIPSPYSIYEKIYKLPPGCSMTIDLSKSNQKIERYWDISKVNEQNISYDKAKSQLHDLLTDAVKIRLQSDVPIGTFLSGGVDSALVSSIAAKISNQKINTFSIGFEEEKYDESKIAEKYAELINSNHTTTICSAADSLNLLSKFIEIYDEPFADSSALPSLLLNSITKKYVTVALSGDGGDESFLGYNYFDRLAKDLKIFKIPRILRGLLANSLTAKILGKDANIFKQIMKLPNKEAFINSFFVSTDTLSLTKEKKWIESYAQYLSLSKNPLQNAADLNIKLWLENDSNVKVDRASMAYSVEVRSPFLDYRIIEFARRLPSEYRYTKGRKKRILRDLLNEYIPEKIFDHPKKGFSIPLASWLKTELKDDVLRILNSEFLDNLPNFDKKKLNKQLDNHMNNKSAHTENIWRVYVFGKWCEQYGHFNMGK